jgi:uncharacterized protein (TIGR02598 family)
MKTKTHNNKEPSAFTLVEVVIALGIAAGCMFALQGLIPSSLKVAANATDQTAATTMLSSIAQDLRNTPSGSNSSPGFGIPMPDLNSTNSTWLTSTNFYLAEDGLGVLSPTQARYGASVTLSNAAAATVTSLTSARIKVYWPATVTPDKAQGSVESVTYFNRQFQRGGTYVAKKSAISPNAYKLGGPFSNNGYNQYGYNSSGRDHDGYDCDGYDCDGYDRDGYDHDGYDHDGRNCDGFDREGNDEDGHHEGCESDRENGCGEDD